MSCSVLLTLLQIFAAAAMAANAKAAFDSRDSAGFVAAYAVLRAVLVVQYLRARLRRTLRRRPSPLPQGPRESGARRHLRRSCYQYPDGVKQDFLSVEGDRQFAGLWRVDHADSNGLAARVFYFVRNRRGVGPGDDA